MVTVTMSVETDVDGSVTVTETDARFARLMYALPSPPPLARRIAVGWDGAVESARAVAVGLSPL